MFWKSKNSHSIDDAIKKHDEIILGNKPRDKRFERRDTFNHNRKTTIEENNDHEILKENGPFDLVYDLLDFISGTITPKNERSIIKGLKECFLSDPASAESLTLLFSNLIALLLVIGVFFCISDYVGKNFHENAANLVWAIGIFCILLYLFIASGRIKSDNPIGGKNRFILSLILRRKSYSVINDDDKYIIKPNYSIIKVLLLFLALPIALLNPLFSILLIITPLSAIVLFPQINFDRRLKLCWSGPYSRLESSIRRCRFTSDILNLEQITEIKVGHDNRPDRYFGYYSLWVITDKPIMIIRMNNYTFISSLAKELSQFLNITFNEDIWDITGIERARTYRSMGYAYIIQDIFKKISGRF